MPTKYKVKIGWLYPSKMNIYGDRGNVFVLQRRAQWRGIDAELVKLEIGDRIPSDVDIFFFGGGQDQEQFAVSHDLIGEKGESIKKAVEAGAAALSVCGGYQLFGHVYRPHDSEPLPGIGLFDLETVAGHQRFIGNVVIDSQWGELVGFENHSGLTFLGEQLAPMGSIRVGHGNNGKDGTEGAIYRNAIGCYLHGSILPKNPTLADWLIEQGLRRRGIESRLEPLPDELELRAHNSAVRRARGSRESRARRIGARLSGLQAVLRS